jgi:hypothetical protein
LCTSFRWMFNRTIAYRDKKVVGVFGTFFVRRQYHHV